MKKLLITLLVLSVPNFALAKSYLDAQLKTTKKSVKYNSVQTLKKNYEPTVSNNVLTSVYDPKLINLSEFSPVSEKDYKLKLAKDEEIYEKEIIPVLKKKISTLSEETLPVDFYNLYRITERLIRANNLEYINWRIAVRKTEEPNAYAANVNSITIHTALYDTFYNNEDALAFILAHEMSHLILGHDAQRGEIMTKMANVERYFDSKKLTYKALRMKYMKEIRDMEYMADTEAITLITKAGFSPQKALSALNTIDAYAEVKALWGLYNTHPYTEKRIESYKENLTVINPQWVEEGKSNIYNSEVLSVKKSSDRVSFVINKIDNPAKFYQVENVEQRLKRLAYASYLNGNYKNAVKYFEKLVNSNNSDYVNYVYLALANKALYNSLKEDKYLKSAKDAINKASDLKSNDPEVQKVKNMI